MKILSDCETGNYFDNFLNFCEYKPNYMKFTTVVTMT